MIPEENSKNQNNNEKSLATKQDSSLNPENDERKLCKTNTNDSENKTKKLTLRRKKPSPVEYFKKMRETRLAKKKTPKKKTVGQQISRFFKITTVSFVCVFLPIGTYVMDCVLTVNVSELGVYKREALDFTAGFGKPLIPLPFMWNMTFDDQHDSILLDAISQSRQILIGKAKEQKSYKKVIERKRREAEKEKSTVSPETLTTTTATTSKSPTSTVPTTTTTAEKTTSTIRISDDEILMQYLDDHQKESGIYYGNASDDIYCSGLKSFYDQHKIYEKDNKAAFERDFQSISSIQQVLFVAFVIFGFLFSIMSMGLRCDIWLNDEWSSNILFGFFPSIITTCLEVVIIAKLYSPSGIKCFTCHLSPHCEDINPMDFENSWPDNVHWIKIFIIGTCIKFLDVFVIAIVSLKFMVDFNQPVWVTTTKFFMWLIVFPWIVVTPVIGVIRWVLVPALDSKIVAMDGTPWLVAFVVGIAMMVASCISLPFLCKHCESQKFEITQEEEADRVL